MNILVYDVAAESGGAASILELFYKKHNEDKTNHYFYMLSIYHLENSDNITVINVPQIKKNWFYRLWFDYIGVKKYIRKYDIDCILSLQNTIVPCFKGKQIVYEHNALPFSEHRFTLREDRLMWVYQNIIGKFILSSIRKADEVIVQTDWMKDEISNRIPNSSNKIVVDFPSVNIPLGKKYKEPKEALLFYPANGAKFKNHRIIVSACELLKNEGISNYCIVFTLQGNENEEISELFEFSKRNDLPIKWIGQISRKEVFEYYEKSALIFPSYIETIGLPIYEAISLNCPVYLADCKYSKSVCKDYKRVDYFDYRDVECVKKCILNYIDEVRNKKVN